MTTDASDDSTTSTAVVLVVFGILALLALGGTGYWFVSKQQVEVAERARLVAESEALLARARLARDQAAKLAEKKAATAAIARAWQSAESLGEWTLVGCTVAPGFEFSGFELAPPGFESCKAQDLGLELVADLGVAGEPLLAAVRKVEVLTTRGGVPKIVNGELL